MSRRRDRITDEAALWFVRAQDPDFSANDREELASWFAASAEHVQEYLSVSAVTYEIHEAVGAYDVDRLVALAREASDDRNVVALLGGNVSTTSGLGDEAHGSNGAVPAGDGSVRSRSRPVLWSMAAGVVLAVFAGFYTYLERDAPDPDFYATGVGEQVSFPLDDGSVVTLNAQSKLRVEYSDEFRDIELLDGEAMFDVEKDPNRRFRVVTDRAVIQAIGTQFNVRNRGGDMTVTVVEGVVDVQSTGRTSTMGTSSLPGSVAQLPASSDPPVADSTPVVRQPTRLKVGQQARVNGGDVAVIETNVQEAISWRERRLVFDAWALEDVVIEFNLYNDQQFFIDDAALATRAISGAFSADDRESFALFLFEAGLAVPEKRADGTIVLRSVGPSKSN